MLSDIKDAVEDLKKGNMLIVLDGKYRENEGDLVIAAEHVTPESINFMITYAKGLVCMPIIGEVLDRLDIPLMVKENTEVTRCQFTVSVDSRLVSTGISAADRALTVRSLIDEKTKPEDLLRPGHIFPLRYNKGGVLSREGHTEAAVDLVKLAGFFPAAVICEIINKDGTMARIEDLESFSKRHDIKIISIEDLVEHIKKKNN